MTHPRFWFIFLNIPSTVWQMLIFIISWAGLKSPYPQTAMMGSVDAWMFLGHN
jgi:hypothetical protein